MSAIDSHVRECLVAHRGCPGSRVENTLAGIACALRAGGRWIEVDVQLTADGVPVLHHDRDLGRLSGSSAAVADLSFDEFSRLRFSERGDDQPPCSLAACVEALAESDVRLIVEVKSVTVERFGIEATLDRVLPVLVPLAARVTLIASRDDLLAVARKRNAIPIGWILPLWSDDALERNRELAPDMAFVNVRKVPEEVVTLPAFGGRWVVYVVDEVEAVRRWVDRGAALVETDRIDVLLAR